MSTESVVELSEPVSDRAEPTAGGRCPIDHGALAAASAGRWRRDAPADRFMRRLLRVEHAPKATAAEARSAFQRSVLVSAVRCSLMYLVFPFVLPAVGLTAGVGPVIGGVIGIVAIVSIVVSMRRFWRADHKYRWQHFIAGAAMIIVLVAFTVIDIARNV